MSEPEELVEDRLYAAHVFMPGDNIVISMLGDAEGNGAGGFAVLDAKTFEVKGRWENGGKTPSLNYDFWYQPRKNVLISSEFGEPNAYEKGFDLDDVAAGHYGSKLHFWNLADRSVEQTIDLGETGLVPLEVRWLHDPEAEEGFVGAALSSTMWRFRRDNGGWGADQVIAVESVELEGWPFPVPGLITDLVLSMDDPTSTSRTGCTATCASTASEPATRSDQLSGSAARAQQPSGAPVTTPIAGRDDPASLSTGAASTSPARSTRPGTFQFYLAFAPGCYARFHLPEGGMEIDRDSSSTCTTARADRYARTVPAATARRRSSRP